jgi:6,7-dimethyl-8-ribityllumazine synthase
LCWCGYLELAPVVRKLAGYGNLDGIVALGCVIRGETAHFEHVGRETASGLARVARESGFPIGAGILTVETTEQARVRSGLDPDPGGAKEAGGRHRGREAALACLEMVDLYGRMRLDLE